VHGVQSSVSSSSSDKARIHTAYVLGIATAAALGGFLFGYDWVVIGGAKPFYEAYFHLDSSILIGWANSCAVLGCLAGTFITGAVNKRLGRNR
jgi:SP family xylose:H+ symportor-like MFS transporter